MFQPIFLKFSRDRFTAGDQNMAFDIPFIFLFPRKHYDKAYRIPNKVSRAVPITVKFFMLFLSISNIFFPRF